MDSLLKAGQSFLQSQSGGGGNGNNNNNNNNYEGGGGYGGNDGGRYNDGNDGNRRYNDNNDGNRRYNDNDNDNDRYGGGGGGNNSYGHSSSSGSVGGFDLGSIISAAQGHSGNNGNSNQSSDLFSQAASFLQNKHGNNPDDRIDEDELMQSHEKVNGGNAAHSNEIGQAAALGAIKSFIGGGGGQSDSSGGSFQQKIIGAAMSQAAQLFDQKQANGEVSGGDKQSAVNQAGEAAMKLLIKHQVSGMIGGGGSSGGLGGLGSLAKFLM